MSGLFFDLMLAGGLVALVALELTARSFRESTLEAPRRGRNFAYLAASVGAMIALRHTSEAVRPHLPVPVAWEVPYGVEAALCFLFGELVNWTLHFIKHRNAFLWRLHFQHHLEEKFNVWLTTHTHPIEVVVSGTVIASLGAIAGFSMESLQLYLLVYSWMKTYQHSAHDYSLGWLDRVFVSPAYHRLHHANDVSGNYGIVLTLFDVLFGTAHWPEQRKAPIAFGIKDGDAPFGFWAELTHVFRARATAELREPRTSAR